MITKYKVFEENSQSAKDWLIDLIENRKGFVRMRRIREKLVANLNRIYDFSEENQTIEKKELTKIKNSLDDLYGAYYGGDKVYHNARKEDVKQIARNKGVSEFAYENPDPAIQAMGMVINYGIIDAQRNIDKFSKIDLTDEEQKFMDKYYSNFDKWAEIHNKIEEIRKVLNPSAKERKEKELKQIKGKLNPKIKKVIDEIAENFRQVIEKNELENYTSSLKRFRGEHGDSVDYDTSSKRKFNWLGGINIKLYQKDPNSPKYSYNYDKVLISNYEEVIKNTANSVSYATIAKFQGKMYDKIGGMVTDIDKDFDIEVHGGDWTYNDIYFKFEDGSNFSIRNKIVSNINQYNTFYYTYPTTFHDAYLPNGEKISNPNEYVVKLAFNEYYK